MIKKILENKYCVITIIISLSILVYYILIKYWLAVPFTIYTDIKDYRIALSYITSEDRISYFPKRIPKEAKNIRFYKSSSPIFGGDVVYLEFNINKKYILNEIKKYKYIETEGPFDFPEKYKDTYGKMFVFGDSPKIDIRGYKLYIIKNSITDNNCHGTCEFGIGVNEKKNTILYYSSDPD